MWRKIVLLVGIFTLIMCMSTPVFAQSIAASPGKITAEEVPLGQRVFLHEVEIINQSDTSHAYGIYTKSPGILKEGYEKIPDPSWIELDISEIEIEAQSKKAIEVWVRIPNNEANANMDYEGWVVARESTGGMVAVEVAVRVLLSTSEYNPSLPAEALPEEAPLEELPPVEEPTSEPTNTPLVTQPKASKPSETNEFPILPLAGIIAGTIIMVTLVITLVLRRRH